MHLFSEAGCLTLGIQFSVSGKGVLISLLFL